LQWPSSRKGLAANAIAYICLDRMYRGAASNCIHALSDLDTAQEALMTGTARGDQASLMVLVISAHSVRQRRHRLVRRSIESQSQ
jgi:hypothetical protein